jgi:lipopolysaccharide/colanic/teichoic acid biosynthesis glycosyltransferase
MERMATRWCHRVITVSEFHRQWGLALGVGDERKLVAIPNGIPYERVEPQRPREEIRAELDTPASQFVILSTGRLAKGKGLEDLLQAAAWLNGEGGKNFSLWFAGDGPLRAGLEQKAAALGLSGHVRFLGFRSDVGNLLAACDLVALPSLREGLSIALLEAMAAAKPIVATTIGSNREVTRNGEAAVLVPPRDPVALGHAIAQIIENPARARELASAAGRIFRLFYTERRMLDRYAEEYRRILTECSEAPNKITGSAVKRGFDIVASSVALALLSPLLAVIAISIRISSRGPALFRQERLGRSGVPFRLFKFRTMFQNAPDIRNPDGSTFNADDDPRVTPLGRFLRAASLDELPQFINVLKGDMSLVGPRPELPDQLRFYSETDKRRLRVRPGLTGLAQISGRNEIAWERRRQLDVEYVSRRSFWMDISLLLKTVPYVLSRRGVYVAPQKESLQ